MKTLHDPKDLRWRTLMAVLASDGEAAARVLGRHPAPPSNPTMGPERLRDLLTGELLHQEFVLASVTGQVAPKGNLDAANFFLRRRALTADRAALQLAERIPWGLARFALSDDESAQRHLIALGLALFAMRTLQITNDRRESFLRPLGTDLARAVVHRLDRVAARQLADRSPDWILRETSRVVDLARATHERGVLVREPALAVLRAALDTLPPGDSELVRSHLQDQVSFGLEAGETRFVVPEGEDGSLLMQMLDEVTQGRHS